MAAKRPRAEHTEAFQELLPLCWWPEQVECGPAADVGAVGRLRRVKGHTLFETSVASPAKPMRLFDLDEVLGE